MNRNIVVLCTIAILSVTGVTMIGVASAQSTDTTTANSTAASGDSSVLDISNTVTLKDYRFNGETIILTIEADYSQPIVVSDMFVSGSGAQEIPQKRMQLSTGTNTIRFDTTSYKGTKGVVIGTTDGAVGVSGDAEGFSFNSKYSGETLIGMFVVATLTGIGLVLAIAYARQIKYTSKVEREV